MKLQNRIMTVFLGFLFLYSCETYKTIVINTVYKDGSVLREVIMKKTDREEFNPDRYKVPVDSTWSSEIKLEIGTENDTTWILNAKKLFKNVEEINKSYQSDSGRNKKMKRSAGFSKKNKWFTTVFRYSEKVERSIDIHCPVSDFLNEKELEFFYLPHEIQEAKKNGPDSLIYKELVSELENKSEEWFLSCLVRKGLIMLDKLIFNDYNIHEDILSKESKIVGLIKDDTSEDSLFIIAFDEIFVDKYKTEIDSSLNLVESLFEHSLDYESYDLKIKMPGSIIATNGYISNHENDELDEMLWTVTEEYFFSEDYEMWAESKINNYYAWIISAIIVLFALSGFLIFLRKKD